MSFYKTDKATDYVRIEMKDGGNIVVELDDAAAPATCKNFRELVAAGFYNGLTFHRIVRNFVIQGGDPLGNGTGGSKKNIRGEFSANGFANNLRHERGVLSMARASNPNSASSQFFICLIDLDYLDGQYAAFGRVVEGMETVDRIASVPTDRYSNMPFSPQVMKEVYFVDKQ